jgi:hypothetical protein
MKIEKILILTPRILLNHQIIDNKYSFYIQNDNYKFIHFSDNSNKDNEIKYLNDKFIMTCCYQSYNTLLEYNYNTLLEYNLKFDLIIFDEAHFISSWNENILCDNNITKYKLFGSATPTYDMEIQPLIYGKIIEKIKVYELINYEILCNIETIIKQLNDNKSEYHNIKDLIIESMTKYNKKKGIIYVNNSNNAEKLYKILKTQNIINVYIYISKNINIDENNKNIKIFENDINKSVIISIAKISYGYDCDLIDFCCFCDNRQSDINIRQIIGRGLRWDKKTYPNKILHILVPLYKDEFNNNSNNEHLKKYLDYIIGECGQDIIFKDNKNVIIRNGNQINYNNNYEGDEIPIELLNDYCTTGYNKFSNFMRFLKSNNIYNETTYNNLKNNQEWMVPLGIIHKKYPKFCFRDIHPNNTLYYWNKNKALESYNNLLLQLDKFKKINNQQKLSKMNELDNKIPNIDLDLYYPLN